MVLCPLLSIVGHIHSTIDEVGDCLQQQEGGTTVDDAKEGRRIGDPEGPMRSRNDLSLYTVGDFGNQLFSPKHLYILDVKEADDYKLNNAHQNHDHILLLPRPLEAVVTHEPTPPDGEEHECNNKDTLSKRWLGCILDQLIF